MKSFQKGLPGLRIARLQRGLTMRSLATATQASERALWGAERGEVDPRSSVVRALSIELGVSCDELLGLTEAQ